MSYIQQSDITDQVALSILELCPDQWQTWFDQVDSELEALASIKGVSRDDIAIPLNKVLVAFCRSVFCMSCFRDVWGMNDIDVTENDKYKSKLDYYTAEVSKLADMISPAMFLGGDIDLQKSAFVREIPIFNS
jgi:hypothetical protein